MLKISEKMTVAVKAISFLVVVIILFVILGQFGWGKISEIRTKIAGAQNSQKNLTQKLDVLRSIKVKGLEYSNLSVLALPDSNPSLSVMSQLKILAGTNSLGITEIKVGSPVAASTGLSLVNISFNVMGSRTQVESFVKGINSFAPITIVDKIKIAESGPGSTTASMTVKSFWSSFPTKLPATTEVLSGLTTDENQVLNNISSLTQPIIGQPSTVAVGSENSGRSNPFTQ
jgi:Tfp pilus assembly protein PilO